MAESAMRPYGIIQLILKVHFGHHHFFYNHLGDPVSAPDLERLFSVIYHYNANQPPVIRIYRTGRIYEAYAVF